MSLMLMISMGSMSSFLATTNPSWSHILSHTSSSGAILLLLLVHLVLAIGAALRLPVAPGAAIVRVARVGALTMAEADEKKWTQSEDWALADAVPQFTVGQSSSVSTFWTALATTTPELGSRSAAECERRFAKLDAEEPAGKQPPVLEDWSKLDDGRYTGRLAGQSSFVWLTVALEGRLASDAFKRSHGVAKL